MKLSEVNEIYEQYYLMVMKVAFNISNDYFQAQDICHDVFLAFLEHCEEISREYVKAWLLVTARRKALDQKKRMYQRREFAEEEILKDLNAEILDVEEEYIRKESSREVLRQMKERDGLWWEIFVRVLEEGENQQHVAKDLGLTLTNLRVKTHRMKAWLRRRFGADDFG